MSSPSHSLQDIAAAVSKNAAIISEFLKTNGLPQPSFDALQGKPLPAGPGFEQLQLARATLLEQTQLLQDLVQGPVEMATLLPLYVCRTLLPCQHLLA